MAKQGQLHGLLNESLLALAVGHVPAVLVDYLLEFVDFPLSHLKPK